MKTSARGIERPIMVYTSIGGEWFTLRAVKARVSGEDTILVDVTNLDENGKVLDTWSEVRLSRVPLLVARD